MASTPESILEFTDPGPAARFEEVIADPLTPERIVQRMVDGETLREMANSWKVPYKRLVTWVAGQSELSAQCRRAMELAGIEMRMDGLEIVDSAEPQANEIALAKLQAEYRERLSRDLNKPLFGKTPEVAIQINEFSNRPTDSLVEELKGLFERSVTRSVTQSVTRTPRTIENKPTENEEI